MSASFMRRLSKLLRHQDVVLNPKCRDVLPDCPHFEPEGQMAQLTVFGEVIKTLGRDLGIRIENEDEARKFWQIHRIDTKLDWFGPGAPVFSIGRQRDISSCSIGDRVSMTVEVVDRNGKVGIKTVDFSVS